MTIENLHNSSSNPLTDSCLANKWDLLQSISETLYYYLEAAIKYLKYLWNILKGRKHTKKQTFFSTVRFSYT